MTLAYSSLNLTTISSFICIGSISFAIVCAFPHGRVITGFSGGFGELPSFVVSYNVCLSLYLFHALSYLSLSFLNSAYCALFKYLTFSFGLNVVKSINCEYTGFFISSNCFS